MSVLQSVPGQADPRQPLSTRLYRSGWFLFLMLLGVSGYLYLSLFLITNVPILQTGDQLFFWMNGQRMLYGERPYVEFFQFTPPGADLFYFAVFKVFGVRIWPLNMVVVVLGVALCWVCFVIAEQIMERHLALLSTLLFLTLVYTRMLNATHHCFSVLAVMGATAALMPGSSFRRLAIAGVMLGVASFFTQTHGVAGLLGITFLLCWQQYRSDHSFASFWGKERILLLSFTISLLVLYAPFISSVGLKELWFFQVTYVRKIMVHLPETHLLGMPQYSDWRTLPLSFLIGEYSRHVFVYLMLPVVYVMVLVRCRAELQPPRFRLRGAALLGLVGSCLLGELMFSLNWLRLYAVSMAGIILFVWVVSTSRRLRQYGVASVWAAVLFLGLSQPWSKQHQKLITVDLPAGISAVEPREYEKLSWGMDHIRPGEFFFQATWPGLYIPLSVHNPVFLDTAGTMLNPRWAEQAVQQLEAKQVRYVFWAPRLDYPADPRRPRTANIIPLRNYVHAHYRLVKVFLDGDEVWKRM